MKVIGFIIALTVLTFSFSQNPLAQLEDLFSGNYIGDTFNLSLERTAEGYGGNIDFDGQIFPVFSQASGNSLTGYFMSGNDHFDIAATLTGESLSFTTGGANYTLMKVAELQQTSTPQVTSQTQSQTPQSSIVISANQQYTAGTILQSPWTGVSFTVPENHIAVYDPEFGGFLMATQDGGSIIAIEASSKAEAVDLGYFAIEALAEFMLGKDASFQLTTPINSVEDLLIAQVLIDQAIISAAAKQGNSGNAAVVLAYGSQAEQLSQTVANTISFTAPSSDVANWQQKMYGIHAYASSSGTDYSSGPTTGSFAGSSKFNYDFCSDGSYRHEYSDISYFSAGTDTGYMIGTVQTGSEGAHQGSWHLVSTLMGELVLILESTEDNLYMHPIFETKEGASINNREYAVTQSEICR